MIIIRADGEVLNFDQVMYIKDDGVVFAVDGDPICTLTDGEREEVVDALIRGNKVLDLRNMDTPSRQELLHRWYAMLDALSQAAGESIYSSEQYSFLFKELYSMAKEIKNG